MLGTRPPFLFLAIALLTGVACSDRNGPMRVVKNDGTAVVGTIVEARPDGIVIKTPAGELLAVARLDIASIESVGQPRPSGESASGGSAANAGNTTARQRDMKGAAGESRAGTRGGAGTDSSSATATDTGDEVGRRNSAATLGPGGSSEGNRKDLDSSVALDPRHAKPSDVSNGAIASHDQSMHRDATARQVIVPAGTRLSLALKSTIDSSTSRPEDRVEATLTRPVMIGGVEALPVGTEIDGAVIESVGSHVKGHAYVVVRFDRVRTDAAEVPIRLATVRREAASSPKPDAKRTRLGGAVRGALGAVVGRSKAAFGVGEAARVGAAAADAAMTRGPEVHLGAGTPLTVRLAEPIPVAVPVR